MIKRTIPPKNYTGLIPDGFKFVRFEEYRDAEGHAYTRGITYSGQAIIIPNAEWWIDDVG